MSPTTLDAIPTLADLYNQNIITPSPTPHPTATSRHTHKISLIRTDITTLAVDAIVNAANTSLLGGGGVDGAIHSAAGEALYDECLTLGGCETGDAKITDAYDLPCGKVIHAVGPVYYSAKREGMHTTLLQSCYTRSLDLAVENGCKSIAFSALSTGVYGYPSEEACVGAVEAVKGWLESDEERAEKIDRVVFCQFMEKDQRAYERVVLQYFTPAEEEETGESEEKTEQQKDNAAPEAEGEETTTEAKLDDDAPDTATKYDEPEEPTDSAQQTDTFPTLPDVPTKEPALPDEPEVKKLKRSQ